MPGCDDLGVVGVIPLSVSMIAEATGARREGGGEGATVRRVSTDSRDIRPGDLFVALRGERLDGHDFVEQAIAGGAVAWLGERKPPKALPTNGGAATLLVENSAVALGRLASSYRRRVMPPSTKVIAVTGSNGKTTTKGMIDHVLGGSMPGRASPKSFNNRIGVPLTLLSAEATDRYLVVEIGTNAPGEVASLAAMSEPDAAVITSIGEAHLEGLGDLHSIAREKTSILSYVRSGGLGVVNVDRREILAALPSDPPFHLITVGTEKHAEVRVLDRRGGLDGVSFTLDGRDRVEVSLPGVHHAVNAACAFVVSRWMGCPPAEIVDRLRSFSAREGRAKVIRLDGLTLVDDSYNANPAAMAAAVESLAAAGEGRRVFVMGDMFELGAEGPSWHENIVSRILEAGIEVLIAVGPLSVEAARRDATPNRTTQVVLFLDPDAAVESLPTMLQPGDTVWIKGSRAMRLERAAARLRERAPRAAFTASVRG
jgi:UDP-N-acetylmuramoyl-tripeptide--D-alanyl-D-alanine ligase